MAVLKKKVEKDSNITPLFSKDNILKLGDEYAELSNQIKELEEKKKALAEKIKEGAEQFGVKDDNGSFYIESDKFIMGKVAKKSFSIKQEEAVSTLESLGIGDAVDIVTVKTVNEDKLQKAVAEGRVPLSVVEGFTTVKTSYAVSVKEKEELPEIEQSNLKSVAKTKSKK